jgi:hypothetical protein
MMIMRFWNLVKRKLEQWQHAQEVRKQKKALLMKYALPGEKTPEEIARRIVKHHLEGRR